MTRLAMVACIAIGLQRCEAKDWYLDARASVNGNGTEESPWNDFVTAAQADLRPGDRLKMKGTYTACTRDPNPWNIFMPRWSGTRDKSIVVENWPGFTFTMDGRMDIKDKGWSHLGNHVYQSAWKYFAEHYYPMAAWYRSRAGAEHMLKLEASRARDTGLPPGRMRVLKDRTILVHLPDDSDPKVAAWLKVPNQVCGIELVRSGADYITFRNFAIHYMVSYGIQTKTTGEVGSSNIGIAFDTLDIGYVNDRGISQVEGDDYHKPDGKGKIAAGTIVRNCTVHHCGQEGIRVAQDTRGAVIADNTFFAENTAPKALIYVPGKGLHTGIQAGNIRNNRFWSPKNTTRVLAIKGEDVAASAVAAFGKGNRYGAPEGAENRTSSAAPGVASDATTGAPLRSLRKIYLSMHQGCWADCTASDPRRKTRLWEQFPGRCELAYRLDLRVQERVLQLIRDAKKDEGILIVPNDLNNAPEKTMIALAKQKFGRRAVVCDWRQPADFKKGLEEDRREAVRRRGANWESPQSSPPGAEFEAWANAKRMAVSLRMQLEEQGYTFDPATVEVVSFGDDWMGCAATYPIHIAGAWDLARGVNRRFDLGISDESLLCLKLEPVEQDLPMPENVRLFIFKAPNEPPAWGRYIAQFWEGKHHVRDLPHVVTVDFPPGTVRPVNTDGLELTLSLGIHRPYSVGGRIEMGVGCGGHTPYPPTLVRAEEGLSLKDFRAALLAGKVSKRTP